MPSQILPSIITDHWVYYLVNYGLAALMWTCIGRFLLGLFFLPDSPNYIWRFFRRLTDPVLLVVAPVTPRFVVAPFLPLVAAFWLFILRFGFWVLMYANGWAPRLSDYGMQG